jgi:tetratricopeptide (TPR) repeat protein
MGKLLEKLRARAEELSEDRDLETATVAWNSLQAAASLAHSPDDARVLAAFARAVRSSHLKAAGRHAGLADREKNARAVAASCSWLFSSDALPDEERLFLRTTLDAAAALAGTEGGADQLLAAARPARSIHEAMFPRPLDGSRGPATGLPGYPGLPPEPGLAELGSQLRWAEAGGEDSAESLLASSRIGGRFAAMAFSLPYRTVFPPGPGTYAAAADMTLRSSAERLMSSLGEEHPYTQDAMARLALFLMRESGPVRLLPRFPGEEPPQRDVLEALAIWKMIADVAGRGPDGADRRSDALLRSAECLVALGLRDKALKLNSEVLDIAENFAGVAGVAGRLPLRGVLSLYVGAGLITDAAAAGAEEVERLHDAVLNRVREILGHTDRLAVRSLCRIADMMDALGEETAGCIYRAEAAGILKLVSLGGDLAGGVPEFPETTDYLEDPDIHVLASQAARMFVRFGDREEALAVLVPAARGLELSLGKRDPRTKHALEILEEARRLPGPAGPESDPSRAAGPAGHVPDPSRAAGPAGPGPEPPDPDGPADHPVVWRGAPPPGGPDSSLLFCSWPEWAYPPMGSLLEAVRAEAEEESAKGSHLTAVVCWNDLRALASLPYGPDDLRALAAAVRASRSLLLDLAGASADRRSTGEFASNLEAAESSVAGALQQEALPEAERRFVEATRDALERVAGKAGLAGPGDGDEDEEGEDECDGDPVSRAGAVWPGDAVGRAVESGAVPSDGGGLPPGPGRDELEREIRDAAWSDGTGSARYLEACSRLGAFLAELAISRVPAPGLFPEEEAREAERLLRSAAAGLESSPGPQDAAAQDAMARLALFLMRETALVRVLPRRLDEIPPRRDLEEAFALWRKIYVSNEGGPHREERAEDAMLRAAECLSMLGNEEEAVLARHIALAGRWQDDPDKDSSPRDIVLFAEMGGLLLAAGDLDGASRHHVTAMELLRLVLGGGHRLTVRSRVRVADVEDASGNPAKAAALRARAAETLEKTASDEGREDPDVHVLRHLAARAFVGAGDRADAVSALVPEAEALGRLAGKLDARTRSAEDSLAEARGLPGP